MKIVQIIAGGYGHRPKAHAPAKLIMAGEFVCLDDAEDMLADVAALI